jgi:hypothetical protein
MVRSLLKNEQTMKNWENTASGCIVVDNSDISKKMTREFDERNDIRLI